MCTINQTENTNKSHKARPDLGKAGKQKKFRKTINIWGMNEKDIPRLKPGQWVSAGKADADRMNCGIFCGVKKGGSVVVAWNGNARASRNAKEYRKTLMTYAKAL